MPFCRPCASYAYGRCTPAFFWRIRSSAWVHMVYTHAFFCQAGWCHCYRQTYTFPCALPLLPTTSPSTYERETCLLPYFYYITCKSSLHYGVHSSISSGRWGLPSLGGRMACQFTLRWPSLPAILLQDAFWNAGTTSLPVTLSGLTGLNCLLPLFDVGLMLRQAGGRTP